MKEISFFGDFLKEQIQREGLNVLSFSKKIGMDDYTVGRWIRCENMPSFEKLIAIGDYFGVSIDFMLGLTETPNFVRANVRCDFADRLIELLKSRGISQYRLAKDCNFEASTISKWVHKTRFPEFFSFLTLAEYFSCSIDFLLGRTDNE